MAPPEIAVELEPEVAAEDGERWGPGDDVTLLLLHSPGY
jgi:hypothetical protein